MHKDHRDNIKKSEIAPSPNPGSGFVDLDSTDGNLDVPNDKKKFKYALLSFVKQILSVSSDLGSLTCPVILLSGKSLLEYSVYWCKYMEILSDSMSINDPFERMKNVTKWFIVTLWQSYASRVTAGGIERKPYNPVLGEQFIACCAKNGRDINGSNAKIATLVSEQVSHHPPITAFNIQSSDCGITIDGFNGQKIKFTGTSMKVQQIGYVKIVFKKFNEEIKIQYPELQVRGIFTGSPFVELSGSTDITSSLGPHSVIHYISKPWFSGEYHCIDGEIAHHDGNARKSIFLHGKWTEKVYSSHNKPHHKTKGGSENHLFCCAKSCIPSIILTKDVDRQGPLETHSIWKDVTSSLVKGDLEAASAHKANIEESQRSMLRNRINKNIHWKPKFFQKETNSCDSDHITYPWKYIGPYPKNIIEKHFE